jgi:peptide chain release factor subunit 1
VQKYFDEISQDTGKYCFGVEETLKALDAGAVEQLIVWDNLEIMRYASLSPDLCLPTLFARALQLSF